MPSPITAEVLATYLRAVDLADEGGIIQAADMVGLVSDRTMHNTTTLHGLAQHLLGGCANEQANADGDTYGDLLQMAGW